MKRLILIVVGVLPLLVVAQNATITTTTNGISPVPLFSAGKPAVTVFTSTKIGKYIEYNPDFTYTLPAGEGWFCDQWLKVTVPLDSAKKWLLTGGVDWSFIFQSFQDGDTKVTRTVRYPTTELRLKFLQSKNNILILDWWHTASIDEGVGVRGSYVSLMLVHTQSLSKKFTLRTSPNLFYISYSDGTHGIASSLDGYITHRNRDFFGSTNDYSNNSNEFKFCLECLSWKNFQIILEKSYNQYLSRALVILFDKIK